MGRREIVFRSRHGRLDKDRPRDLLRLIFAERVDDLLDGPFSEALDHDIGALITDRIREVPMVRDLNLGLRPEEAAGDLDHALRDGVPSLEIAGIGSLIHDVEADLEAGDTIEEFLNERAADDATVLRRDDLDLGLKRTDGLDDP